MATTRVAVVIALSLLYASAVALDLRQLWIPGGLFGYGTDLNGVVTSVDPGSSASQAHIEAGDRVLAIWPNSWFLIQVASVAQGGLTYPVELKRGDQVRTVTLTSTPDPLSGLHKFVIVLEVVILISIIAIGAAVVLMRPSLTTWGFFVFCLPGSVVSGPLSNLIPMPYDWIALEFFLVMSAVSVAGLLFFALGFVNDTSSGWRRVAVSAVPVVGVLFLGLDQWQMIQTYWIGGPPANAIGVLELVANALVSLAALYGFVDTYLRAKGVERQRIQWVLAGFGISLAAGFANGVISQYFTNAPTILFTSINLLYVAAPLAIAYAVVRYRVIDVNFVVSRALVYGILTTLLVGVFSVIDWVFTDQLRLARFGTVAEVAAVVAFGMWFNGLHRRVDSLIDATFYRQRHRAEVQLARNAAALPYASSARVVTHALVDEPLRALDLASAALFVHVQGGGYIRETAQGWGPADIVKFEEADEHLIALLLAENGPLRLYDHPWRTLGVPDGPARPAVALPIIVRREIAAVVFYGSHSHGEPLDPDEIRTLASLAPPAAAAYDHLEAEALREENESIRGELDALRLTLTQSVS